MDLLTLTMAKKYTDDSILGVDLEGAISMAKKYTDEAMDGVVDDVNINNTLDYLAANVFSKHSTDYLTEKGF
jgi:hypothetical protein